MRINVEDNRFTRADVLKLIPRLKSKLLENWCDAGLVDFRMGGKNRLLSALGVIKLAAMHEAVSSGMRPPAAAELASKITPRIYELWAGLPQFPEASQRKVVPLGDGGEMPFFYVEVDVLVAVMFGRILRHVGVLPTAAPPPARKPKAAKKGQRK